MVFRGLSARISLCIFRSIKQRLMTTNLTDMTLEELWELFPIVLVPHDDGWAEQFAEMKSRLYELLSAFPITRISHIGSTAVPGIWAKPIVDILVEFEEDTSLEAAANKLEENGFITMSASERRISLNYGYTPAGFAEKVFHIHLRQTGDNDELYFRDYLRDHEEVARDYEQLKLQLWKQYEKNRDAYTNAKAEFVKAWTNSAKQIYSGRY